MKVRIHYVLCFLLNIGHLYYLCDEYFAFEVTTHVTIAVPDKIEVPAATFCSPISENIRWDILSMEQRKMLLRPYKNQSLVDSGLDFADVSKLANLVRSKSTSYDFSIKVYLRLLSMYNASHIINNITRTFGDIIHKAGATRLVSTEDDGYVTVYSPRNSNWQFVITRVFMMHSRKCFTVQLKDSMRKFVDYARLLGTTGGQSYLTIFQFQSHSGALSFYTGVPGLFITWTEKANRMDPRTLSRLTYQTFVSRLLEYPYTTKCRNYASSGLISRSRCRQECIKYASISLFNAIIDDISVDSDDNFPIISRYRVMDAGNIIGTSINRTEKADITMSCENQCSQSNCYSVIDVPSVTKETISDKNGSAMWVYISSFPVIKTKAQSSIPLIVFLTNVLSTSGIWFGLSALRSFLEFQEIMHKLRECVSVVKTQINSKWAARVGDDNGTGQPTQMFVRNSVYGD